MENMQISIVGGKGDGIEEAKYSDDDDEEEEEDHFQDDVNAVSQKHHKHTDLIERNQDDMDFPDEVDTPLKEARKRFQKYRGIKSLKNCDWDPYENLPVEYSKIF